MTLFKAVHLARKEGKEQIVVPLSEVEILLARNKQMDEKLAACMDYIPQDAFDKIFGDLGNL